jgi:hypothetical protein
LAITQIARTTSPVNLPLLAQQVNR